MLAASTLLSACLTKDVAKDVAERLTKAAKACCAAGTTAHIGVYPCVAKLVISRAFFRVGEHLVGFFGLFEFHFCRGIALVAVRVVFHGHLAVGLFDVLVAGVFGYTQNFVKVAFGGHGCI